jgi:23S rRNA pseudouridine1911/1915/1917 synthase
MPSKNMIPKGKRRHSVKKEYRAHRTLLQEREEARKAAGIAEEESAGAVAEDAPESYATPSPFAHVPGLVTTGPGGGKHPQPQAEKSQPRYRAVKIEEDKKPAAVVQVLEDLDAEDGVRAFAADAAANGMRLDAYLAKALPDISRARVQLLIEGGQVTVDGAAAKAKLKLRGGERIEIEGEPRPAPLHAVPEDLPLKIVYEDDDIAVIDKAAGMTVHAGAGESDDARNRGTLVNALLFHFGKELSGVGGEARPGLVHRLDKETSGLIVVAKNDSAHRKLAEAFAARELRKVYVALVQGDVAKDEGTVDLPISRDMKRRIRMTTRRPDGRKAVSHWKVLERIESPWGKFTLLEVRIETGRTHQIRVHLQAIGHPVVGDTLYGAAKRLSRVGKTPAEQDAIVPERNFLHAAELDLDHPRTRKALELRAPLPVELEELLDRLRG